MTGEETFASYFLSEVDWTKKLNIVYFLKKKTGIYYDNLVVFKTAILKLFLDYLHQEYQEEKEIDDNLVLSARLLCDCKKVLNSRNHEEIKSYAGKGAELLSLLGFDKRFCRICEGVNRYTIKENREPESDLLEIVDHFGGMLLDRPERIAMDVDEALILLVNRNFKGKYNRYLDKFVEFVNYAETLEIAKEVE